MTTTHTRQLQQYNLPTNNNYKQDNYKNTIIYINYNWVVTRWQWLFYMYTEYETGYY